MKNSRWFSALVVGIANAIARFFGMDTCGDEFATGRSGNRMLGNRILLSALGILLLITPLAFSQQMAFEKVEKNDSIQFHYAFSEQSESEKFKTSFLLNKASIQQSYTMIPNLNDLRKNLKPYFEVEAKRISDAYLVKLNKEIAKEITEIYHSNLSKNTIPNGFAITLDCPDEAFITYTFTYSISGVYQYSYNIRSCGVQVNTDKAGEFLLQAISTEVDSINAQLDYGSKLILIKKQGGAYNLKSSLTAPDEPALNKMKTIIKTGYKNIDTIHKTFSNNTKTLQAHMNTTSKKIQQVLKQYKEKMNILEKKVSKQFALLQKQKFKENYFLIETIRNRPTIILDYAEIVNTSAPALKSLSNSLLDSNLIERAQIQKILSFLQTIPYNTLMGREIEGYSGYLPPLALIDKNKGDCDSKSVALISIMKNIYPHINTALILIEGHAFVGMEIPSDEKDSIVTNEGIAYVVAEPVGPATINIGTPSDASTYAIKNKKFQKIIVF